MNDPDSERDAALKAHRAGADAAGMRLDQWLAAAAGPDLSRSRAQQLIREGAVTVDGTVTREPKAKMRGGEQVEIAMPEPRAAEPEGEAIALSVLHEDDDIIVVDKPAGLVVHPGAGNRTGTLVNALIHHCGASLSGIGGVARPGIVHRLDKDTSGVMVVAKTDLAHRGLSAAFADHGRGGDLRRAYLALVWGWPRESGTIDAPIGRSRRDRTRQAVVSPDAPDARHAVTHFRVVERFGAEKNGTAVALVECRLETGRTHQIRVHMDHIGHPVIGDPDYGASLRTKANRLPEPLRGAVGAFERQALHACLLGFRHPATDAAMLFEADPPPDMAGLIAAFRALPAS